MILSFFKLFLPDEVRGNILLTSRNPNWMHAAEPIELGLLDPDYSALYLQQRSGVSDPAAALQLANLLGNLPLALEQAGAYIEATRCSLADYIEEYNKYKSKLLQLFQPYNYNFTVVKVTELALERIRDSKPDALCLLNAMSFLHPEDIPKDLFVQDDTDLELEHYPIRDSLTLNSYIYELRRFFYHSCGSGFAIHAPADPRDCTRGIAGIPATGDAASGAAAIGKIDLQMQRNGTGDHR